MEPLNSTLETCVDIYTHTRQIDAVSYNVMQSIILEMFPLNLKARKYHLDMIHDVCHR